MILKYAIKNLYRQVRHSLLIICVAFVLFLLFYKFIMNIKVDEAEIDRMYHTVEVTGIIKKREANYVRYQIPLDLVNQVIATGFIEHEVLDTKYYAFTFSPYGNVSLKRIDSEIIRVDSKNYIDLANQANIIGATDIENSSFMPKDLDISLAEGYDIEMFSKDLPICIVDKTFLEYYQLAYGDSIGIIGEFANEFYMYTDVSPEEITQKLSHGLVFTICGSYEYEKFSMNTGDPYMLGDEDFIVPARALLNNFDKYYLYDKPKSEFYLRGNCDFLLEPAVYKASFTIKNTKELNTFRQFLIDNGLSEDYTGDSEFMFVLNDDQLISSIRPLQSSLNFKKRMLGLIYFLICIISFFISILTTYRRLAYIAILRSLGTSRLHAFIQILLEHMILGGIGVAIAIIFIMILNIKNIAFPFLEIFLYYIIYLSGSIIALIFILRISTIKVLTKGQE
jgi:hypothetical protein